MKCGFIGLGSQGGPMARRMIDAGLPVTLWARRPATLEPYKDSAAQYAQSVSELGQSVDICCVCVVDDAGVRQVCDELMPAMASGGCIVIHSTVNPELCRDLARKAAERGLKLVDAPVSGGGDGAAAGTLTVILGGEANAVATVMPVLETFAGKIVHLGDVGAGQIAKLVNNTLMAANLSVAHYCIETAKSLGIDQDALTDLVRVSSGRSFAYDVRARMPVPSAFDHGAKLLQKDIGLLGKATGDNPNYNFVRDVASAFIDLALDQGNDQH